MRLGLLILFLISVFVGITITWDRGSILKSISPADVTILNHKFPVIEYQGLKSPFIVKFQNQIPPRWVRLGQISKAAIGAVIVSEDWAFYQHKGFDPNQIREVLKEFWEEKKLSRGASTITQQLAKNLFLSQKKTLWRKGIELYLSLQLERKIGKKKILENYLNIAEWGEGIFGIQQASYYYFQKAPSQLTAKEGAFLAMLLPSPKRYSQSFRKKKLTNYARETVNDILEKMEQAKYLTEAGLAREFSVPLEFEEFEDIETQEPSDESEDEPMEGPVDTDSLVEYLEDSDP